MLQMMPSFPALRGEWELNWAVNLLLTLLAALRYSPWRLYDDICCAEETRVI